MAYKMKGFSKHQTADLTKKPVGPRATVKPIDHSVPLSPGYEDTEKIQKVQKEGITPHSQKFGNFKALKEVKWQPAFPGADHSKEELEKMSKKEKKDYYE